MSVTSSEIGAGVLVTLSRPDRANAIDRQTAAELRAALRAAGKAGRFIILQGTAPFFCCGLDRAEVSELFRNWRTAAAGIWEFESVSRDMRALPVPVVTFAEGAVVGGGCGMFWSADASLAGDGFRLRLQFARLGLRPDMGCSSLGPRRTGHLAFERLFLQDPMLDATEAQAHGLTDNVGAATCDLDTAIAHAERLSHGFQVRTRRPRGLGFDMVLASETFRNTRRGLRLDVADLTRH